VYRLGSLHADRRHAAALLNALRGAERRHHRDWVSEPRRHRELRHRPKKNKKKKKTKNKKKKKKQKKNISRTVPRSTRRIMQQHTRRGAGY